MIFHFWKNDREDLHFTLTEEELIERFIRFIRYKSRIWIRRSYGVPAIAAFMIHDLESTYDENQAEQITKLLTRVQFEVLQPYITGIEPPGKN